MTKQTLPDRSSNPDMRIRFATSNPLKLQEAMTLVPDLVAFDCDLPEIQAIDVREVVRHKIQVLAEKGFSFPLLVEDTGLEVPSMGLLPGALVKWFITSLGAQGFARRALIDAESLPATAVSAVAAYNGSETFIAIGRVNGLLVPPRNTSYGWNSVFQPLGHHRTFGEMSDAERLAISMRRAPILEAVAWIRATRVDSDPNHPC